MVAEVLVETPAVGPTVVPATAVGPVVVPPLFVVEVSIAADVPAAGREAVAVHTELAVPAVQVPLPLGQGAGCPPQVSEVAGVAVVLILLVKV